jgi:hypothetical protein
MLFFKSKAKKEEERKEKEWNELGSRAIGQLKSSMFDVGQVQRFCSFMASRRYNPNGFAILQDLVEAKLFDGTPLLSKFFIYSSNYERECSIGIHNCAMVAFIDQTGFYQVDIGKGYYDGKTTQERAKYLNKQYMTDSHDVKNLTDWCDKYYKALENLRAYIATTDKTLLMPQFSKLRWTGYDFIIETVVRPDRLNAIIEHLKPLNLKYLNEYREYLISCMANDSINTSSTAEKKVRDIQFDYPETVTRSYTSFETMHEAKLNREAKNLEHKSVIDEIRAAAEEKVKKNENS